MRGSQKHFGPKYSVLNGGLLQSQESRLILKFNASGKLCTLRAYLSAFAFQSAALSIQIFCDETAAGSFQEMDFARCRQISIRRLIKKTIDSQIAIISKRNFSCLRL